MVESRTERELILMVEFPEDVRQEDRWGALRHSLSAPRPERLTAREQEVLDLVTQGLSNAEIGAKLGTAVHTVKNQISSILNKMDAANRTELAALAAQRKRT
jgi:DNA-binding NarL/FixJ family response regulator